MAFWNKLLKKQKKERSPKASLVNRRKVVGKEKEEKEKVESVIAPEREIRPIKDEKRIKPGLVRRTHITEKSSADNGAGKYTFVVSPRANKTELKKDIEARYGVNVVRVNIVITPGKERKRGKQIGWKQGFKKAIVTLKEGQSIEIQ